MHPERPTPLRAVGAPEPSRRPAATVVVSESGTGRFGQRIRAGRHVLAADEPAPFGDDTGPSPYDLLLAALGACTSMTLRLYADKKGWPLEGVTVSLRHERVAKGGPVDKVHRVIELTGDLGAAQRTRLLEIADRCPVHRTLAGEVLIQTVLTAGPPPAWAGSA